MKEVVKVLLEKGIDEDTIHEVLDIIEAGVDIPDFVKKDVEERMAKEKKEREAAEARRKEEARKFIANSTANFRMNVKGHRNTPGPMIK